MTRARRPGLRLLARYKALMEDRMFHSNSAYDEKVAALALWAGAKAMREAIVKRGGRRDAK